MHRLRQGAGMNADLWRQQAACAADTTVDWFPLTATRYIRPQQQICAGCPVAQACAAAALDAGDQYGIRAGVRLDPGHHGRDRKLLRIIAAGGPVLVTAPIPAPPPAYRPSRKPQPARPPAPPMLSDDDVRAMRHYRAAGTKVAVLATLYGVSSSAVSGITLGHRRADAGGWIVEAS